MGELWWWVCARIHSMRRVVRPPDRDTALQRTGDDLLLFARVPASTSADARDAVRAWFPDSTVICANRMKMTDPLERSAVDILTRRYPL